METHGQSTSNTDENLDLETIYQQQFLPEVLKRFKQTPEKFKKLWPLRLVYGLHFNSCAQGCAVGQSFPDFSVIEKSITKSFLEETILKYVKHKDPIATVTIYRLSDRFSYKIISALNAIQKEVSSSTAPMARSMLAHSGPVGPMLTYDIPSAISTGSKICYHNPVLEGPASRTRDTIILIPVKIVTKNESIFADDEISDQTQTGSEIENEQELRSREEGIIVSKKALSDFSPYFNSMFNSSFAESKMNEIEISYSSNKSLNYLIHTISGCRHCTSTIIDDSYTYQTACEIIELSNRFLLNKKLVNYIESNMVQIFQNQEANLDFYWSNFFNQNYCFNKYSEFQHLVFENGMSFWKKYILMELIKKSVDNEKWLKYSFSDEEIGMISKEYAECLNF